MLNILCAYPYMKQREIDGFVNAGDDVRFLLDSGAFTAWKSGKPIELNDYMNFIKGLPFKPWRYFALDKIGDAKGTLENYNIMLKNGLNPIPVFTRGEDISMIDEYYKTSDVIGIGGLVGTQGNKGFVKGLMKVIGDRKCHWLGFNAKAFIAHYKPYSCDSSSWAAALRFASVKLYKQNGEWLHVGKKDFITKPKKEIYDLIHSYGMDPRRLAHDSEWKNSGSGKNALELLTCRSWVKYQLDLRQKLGVEFFLATGTFQQTTLMIESYKYWTTKGLK